MSGISGHVARKRGLESYVPEPTTIETPYPLRCPLGSFHPDAKDYYLDNLRVTIKTLGADKIAALLMEPINGSSGGAITPPEGYWLEAEEILKFHTHDHDHKNDNKKNVKKSKIKKKSKKK